MEKNLPYTMKYGGIFADSITKLITSDVLYISFGEPQFGIDEEIDDAIGIWEYVK